MLSSVGFTNGDGVSRGGKCFRSDAVELELFAGGWGVEGRMHYAVGSKVTIWYGTSMLLGHGWAGVCACGILSLMVENRHVTQRPAPERSAYGRRSRSQWQSQYLKCITKIDSALLSDPAVRDERL